MAVAVASASSSVGDRHLPVVVRAPATPVALVAVVAPAPVAVKARAAKRVARLRLRDLRTADPLIGVGLTTRQPSCSEASG